MLHIYHGDGKGKTTAALGLTLRALGRGWTVTILQFMKSENSGERTILRGWSGVTLIDLPQRVKFSFQMDDADRAEASARYLYYCQQVMELAAEGKARLLVLDELCSAVNTGLLPLETALNLLDSLPEGTEVVITGRNPPQALLDRADYITQLQKERHPYDQGITARAGIEY